MGLDKVMVRVHLLGRVEGRVGVAVGLDLVILGQLLEAGDPDALHVRQHRTFALRFTRVATACRRRTRPSGRHRARVVAIAIAILGARISRSRSVSPT